MQDQKLRAFLKELIQNLPADWLRLTTHRLDIYHEELAKTEFIEEFEKLYHQGKAETDALSVLPTAFDYIRLGHPLSCVLEWAIAKLHQIPSDSVISFSSRIMPILAVLRKNLIEQKKTQIAFTGELPKQFDSKIIRKVYGYNFELRKVESPFDIQSFEGSTIFITEGEDFFDFELQPSIDFYVNLHADLGSFIIANGKQNEKYIGEIQHVRRRESIAMTPVNCLVALQMLTGKETEADVQEVAKKKASVLQSIETITGAHTKAVLGSSGLSIQYAITMGLIHDAMENHPGKEIKIAIPPNCYGGTNDQARRVAACLKNVTIVDLPVDREHNMVDSIDQVLNDLAKEDAVPYILVEIPTNPRVEVPDLDKLKAVLTKSRKTDSGEDAIDPVFILDQTFCPNVHFLGEEDILADIRSISYVSGSKFPSGGRCTAGYCLANKKAEALMEKIDLHLRLCDNEATDLQIEILSQEMPSMIQRIADAYNNTREFVNFIQAELPSAKINFVSEELAERGFTPSVFSLDLPTKGESHHEREEYKRKLNHKLINMMISQIPESKYCVSYGQLKGCYWTIPATSTQGTTKEEDKDYIARVSCSGNMDLEKHKMVFSEFVKQIESQN